MLTFSSNFIEQLIGFFKDYYNSSPYKLILDLVILLGIAGFMIYFMWKFTSKKWLILSLTFFVALFVVIVVADLKMAYRIYKYLVLLYFFGLRKQEDENSLFVTVTICMSMVVILFAFMLFSQPIALAYLIILSKKFGNVRKM